ncbi:hypothetical protein CN449_14120 [Bacillus thuringiensis]|uniref:hypothetical protein n=1 Tax=Bacillus thuringiensis TaxID=1428 RepID=UPI000BF6F0AC|nr:hypothetical protein [Bacillus thuringiensis]PEW74424.1 hypothetical protein CN449_14120 [Bacillus thuringiensis]
MQKVMNMIQTENILLVTPLEWNMIMNKEKWVVFQNEISEKLIQKINERIPNEKRAWISETFLLKDKETGKLLGEANGYKVYQLLYDVEKESGYNNNSIFKGVVEARYYAVKHLYYEWCSMKSLKPNPNEGWFKSKKFSKYLDTIGWGSNYAVFIQEVIKY